MHFIGHGFWDARSGKSGLVLEDGKRGQFFLGDRSLREILLGRKIRVVFLNACDTGRSVPSGSRHAIIAGTAQDLFGRGVPNVVANQLKVGDKAAATFAKAFYDYLARGKTIAQATREARIACSYRPGMHSIDWAVPVVYARDADDALVGRANWLEPFRAVGRRIGEWRLAGHHLGQQPAAHGPEREAQVMVAEVEPQPLVLRRAADDGQHVRQARPAPQPRLGLDALAQRKDLARQRLDAGELHRGRRAHRAARTRRPW